MMQKPAKTKARAMMRRAGVPMASIFSEASKKESRKPGKSSKMARPTAMMVMAERMDSLMVLLTRSGFLAP